MPSTASPTRLFTIKGSGAGVAKDFERLLKTGDIAKLTPRLYHHLVQYFGFIAHYDIHGFRSEYAGRLVALLHGEGDDLRDLDRARRRVDYRSSIYERDELTAGQVNISLCEIAVRYYDQVYARELAAERERDMRQMRSIAAKYNLPLPDGAQPSTAPAAAVMLQEALF